MNIIFATIDEVEKLREKYTVLELDTFLFNKSSDPATSWCVLDTTTVSLNDLPQMYQFVDLHNNMMRNYRLRNWKYCEDALEHLMGKWRGEVDSFYAVMEQRIRQYQEQDPGPDWNGYIKKSSI